MNKPHPMSSRANRRRTSLVAAMVFSVIGIAALTFWDADRESMAALQDFAQEQATLAEALACVLRIPSQECAATDQSGVLAALRAIERPHMLVLLQHQPGESAFRTTEGVPLQSPRLMKAVVDGQTVVRLTRDEAERFGLHRRTALAGIARVDTAASGGATGTRDVVAVASAERQRDREGSARHRLILSVFTAAGLVLAFGGIAMRLQRNELVLERELAVSALQQKRDERLQRADRAAVLGTLAMGVAHEISTPLGIIAARAEQMMPKVETDERLAGSINRHPPQTDGSRR